MWWEQGFDPLDEPGFVAALADALLAHRDFGDLATVTLPRTGRHRPLATAIRAALAIRDAGPRRAAVGRCNARRRPSTKTGPGPRTKPTLKEALDG
jgi:hypothetical protein